MSNQAYQLIGKMRYLKIPINRFVDQSTVDAIYKVGFSDVRILGNIMDFRLCSGDCRYTSMTP
jgi:hypothetical protein